MLLIIYQVTSYTYSYNTAVQLLSWKSPCVATVTASGNHVTSHMRMSSHVAMTMQSEITIMKNFVTEVLLAFIHVAS